MPFILNTHNLEAWQPSKVGGKGYALAQMLTAGIQVPEAFCVTVDAYKAYIEQPGGDAAIQSALRNLRLSADAPEQEAVIKTLRINLLLLPIPSYVAEEIARAYTDLFSFIDEENGPVAVRSSATAEDLPNASFAGQHDSYLFITGLSEVLTAIRNCWISLWTARAIQYREQQRIDHSRVWMAVVVQRMVRADVAGVLFTVHPLSANSSAMMVNAVWGVGETLVSGEVIPDEWVIKKDTGEIAQERIAEKEIMAVDGEGLLRREPVPFVKRKQPTLSTEELEQLRKIGLQLEEYFQRPQDIEWAIEKGQLYVVQSRPITGQPVSSTALDTTGLFQVDNGYWTRIGFEEWFQLPLSPLFSTFLMPVLQSEINRSLEKNLALYRPLPTWSVLNGYYYARGDISLSLSVFYIPIRFWYHLHSSAEAWRNHFVPEHLHRIEELSTFNSEDVSPEEVLEHLKQICKINAQGLAWIVLTGVMAKTSEILFARLYRIRFGGTEIEYTALLAGYPSKSIEADQSLWLLSEDARAIEYIREVILQYDPPQAVQLLASSEEASNWYRRFCTWIDQYGHRVFDLDILHGTIHDDPSIALQIVRTYLQHPTKSPEQLRQQRAEERAVLEQEILSRLSFLSRKFFNWWLSLAQRYAAIRESRPFYLHLGWPLMRKDALDLGQRLINFQMLSRAEDVFFLTGEELIDGVTQLQSGRKPGWSDRIHLAIQERRQEWRKQKNISPPLNVNSSFVIRLFGRLLPPQPGDRQAAAKGRSSVLKGSAGSPGKVRGHACIVKTQSDFGRLKQGQILVVPYTTPAWTPLLTIAAGVVTAQGGTLSHAAIVAREYGIPAVIGVVDILDIISDGEEIEIDGSIGHVYLIRN